MELALRKIGPNLVVSFVGKVNLEGEDSTVFKDKLKSLIVDGSSRVVIDLGNIGFVDSQGLGALISGLKVLRHENGVLKLANLSEPVEAVLRITRLLRVFDVHESVEDALRAMNRTSAVMPHGA
jgi:anti-sigma B factor antagonist